MNYDLEHTDMNPKFIVYIPNGVELIHLGYIEGLDVKCMGIPLNGQKKPCRSYGQAKLYLLETYKRYSVKELREQRDTQQTNLF